MQYLDEEVTRWLLIKTKTQIQNAKKDLCGILVNGIIRKDDIFTTVKEFDEIERNLTRSIELVQNTRKKNKDEHINKSLQSNPRSAI
jgi:hypothetical protein